MSINSQLLHKETVKQLLAAALMPIGIFLLSSTSAYTHLSDLSAVLLTLVVFSGLLGGMWIGLWAAALQLIYTLWVFARVEIAESITPYIHWSFVDVFHISLSEPETKTLITYLIAAPVVAIVAGLSRYKLETTRNLTAAQERFTNTIFEQAGVAISYSDVGGTILRCNKTYSDIVGRSQDEVVGMNFKDFVDPRDREENLTFARQLLAGLTDKFTLENRYIRKDGNSVWSRKIVTLIRTDAGEPSHILAFATDITHEMALKAHLKKSEANYRTLWESSGSAKFLLFSPEFRIEQANGAAVHLFGARDQQQLSTLRLSDQSPERQDDGEKSADREQRILEDALRDGGATFDWHLRTSEGKDVHININVTRVEALGRIGLQCSATDITDRVLLSQHQANAQRRLAEEVRERTAELEDMSYELYLAQTVGGMGSFSVDLMTGTFSCSPEAARILNIEQFDKIQNAEWSAKVHPADRQAVIDAWRKAVDGAPYDVTYRIVVPDGVRHVKSGARFNRDSNGKAVSAIGALLDLTSLLADRDKNVMRGHRVRVDGLLAATAAVQADAEQNIETDRRKLAESLLKNFPDWKAEELDAVIEEAIATIKGPRR